MRLPHRYAVPLLVLPLTLVAGCGGDPAAPAADVTAATTKEFVAWLKARPGQVNYASAGIGNPTHLAAELFNFAAGTDMRHIPYKGAGPVVIDLVAGHIQVASLGFPSAMSYVQAGRLRALEDRGRETAAAMAADPEDAIAPADEGTLGRAGAKLGAAVGTLGEAIDSSRVGRLARRRAT